MMLEVAAKFSHSLYGLRLGPFFLFSPHFHDLMTFYSEIKEQLLNEE